ncbi:MAG: DUF1553 domain-containing protein [Planctomycetota bacterium]|nr:DUF1553 domain-containing protein [Planctomycetota bacterium]
MNSDMNKSMVSFYRPYFYCPYLVTSMVHTAHTRHTRLRSMTHAFALVLACAAVSASAQSPIVEKPAASVPVVLTDEERAMIEALNAALARYDKLISEVPEPAIRAENRTFADTYKDRRDALQKTFDQTKYDDLRDALNIAHQRLLSWMTPPQLLAPAKNDKPKPENVSPAHAEAIRFSLDVLPILSEHCYHCHGPDEKAREAGLRLDVEEGATGGDRPAIVRGQSEASELIRRILSADPDEVMPPPSKSKLTPQQIELLKRWVDEGAGWGGHWAFEPVKKPTVPEAGEGWALNEIDRFIAAGHLKANIKPVGDADHRALIRRATFDLTGLPPTAEEVDAFLRECEEDISPSANAYARLIDRLLDSKAHGERWGRHWLDVARYADTAGDAPDYPIQQAWRYRNYVIDAFNADKPYDQFLREQIAGDLLPAKDDAQRQGQITATGFIALSRRFFGGKSEKVGNLTFEDTLDTLGRATMGLTMSCARCHDHKFDPIPTSDYYAMYGFFESTIYPSTRPGMKTTIPLVTEEQRARILGDLAGPVAEMEAKIAQLSREIDTMIGKGEDAKSKESELKEVEKELAKLKKELPEIPSAYAVIDANKPKNAKLQIRGEQSNGAAEVPRGFLQVLGGQKLSADTRGSGRLELADWIASKDNPLTTRVIVNRLWHHHFGRGIVTTTNDFGSRGGLPSNPELLDWLADRLVAENWSLKQMHRLIMLSRTYQLAVDDSPVSFQRDPNNALVWRHDRRRLTAEEARDSMMIVSGVLDRTQPEGHPFGAVDNLTEHTPFRGDFESMHRSVYVMQQRNRRHPFFELFDGANTASSTGERGQTITPSQALFQLNSQWVSGWSHAAAERVKDAGDAAAQVKQLYRIVLARDANDQQVAQAVAYLKRFESIQDAKRVEANGLASLTRALFASNEFMFIE